MDVIVSSATASHFASRVMMQAIELYRSHFRPSADLENPYMMSGVPLVAADTDAKKPFRNNFGISDGSGRAQALR